MILNSGVLRPAEPRKWTMVGRGVWMKIEDWAKERGYKFIPKTAVQLKMAQASWPTFDSVRRTTH